MIIEELVSVNSVEDCFTTKERSDTESIDLKTNVFNHETCEVEVSNANTCKVLEKNPKLVIQ